MSTTLRRDEPLRFPIQVALAYAIFSVAWLVVWDLLVGAVPIDERLLVFLRRTTYIAVTAFALWWLIRRGVRRIQAMSARFDAIADQSVVGVFIARGDRLVYVNDSLARMLGRSRETLLSRPRTDFLDPSEHERVRGRGWGPEGPDPQRLVLRHADGSAIPVDVAGHRVELEDGPAFAGIVLEEPAARSAVSPPAPNGSRARTVAPSVLAESAAAVARYAAHLRVETRADHVILVVDDEPAVRRVIAAALRRQGYQVLEAAEGRSALEQLEQTHVDLVICDYLLPGMTGLDLIQRMLALHPEIKVLFVTGHELGDLVERHPDLASYPSLQKPFSVEELTRSVDRMWEPAST